MLVSMKELQAQVKSVPAYIIGIDPGLKGAIAIIKGRRVVDIRCTPLKKTTLMEKKRLKDYDYQLLASILAPYANTKTVAIIEKVSSMPKQGLQSTFNFGRGYGMWLGLLAGLNIPVVLVRPSQWKVLLGLSYTDKKQSIKRVMSIYPEVNLIPKGARTEHDGMAEALLIAMYGGLNLWR